MKGCRPLSESEIRQVLDELGRSQAPARNRALVLVGLACGFRISELLSIRLGDVYQNGTITDSIYVARKHMKGKQEGRGVPLHPEARAAIEVWVREILKLGLSDPQTFLFLSREGLNEPLDRRTAWYHLKRACKRAGLSGKCATHSLRKTFAQRVHKDLGENIFKTQQALGHKDPKSTTAYLSFDQDEIDKAILKSKIV